MIRGYDGDIWYKDEEVLDLEDCIEVVYYRNPDKPRNSYLPLLEKRWEEYKDLPSLAYLVREYSYNAKWYEIINMVEYIEEMCVDESSEACMCYIMIGLAREYCGDKMRAEDMYLKAIEFGRQFRRGYVEYARFLIDDKRAYEAYSILEDGLKETWYTTHVIFVDPGDLWTWRYEDWLCVAAYWSNMPVISMKHALNAYDIVLASDDLDNHVGEHVKQNLKECWTLLKGGF